MPARAKTVAGGLKNKGFSEQRDGHHRYYWYVTDAGLRTKIRTHISHGEREIHHGLLGAMARQVKLSGADFKQLWQCPLSRAQYEVKLRQAGAIE